MYAGMVLAEPPPTLEDLGVRPVETFEEFAAGRELGWATVGAMTEEERERARGRLNEAWEEYRRVDILVFAAFVDGRPVACARLNFSPYGDRALVRACWDAAAARGTPLLAAQAGKMSKPILERLGFRQIATVHALVDSA